MAKTRHGMLVVLEKNIEVLAGKQTAKKVMEGSENITEKTDKKKIAEWVKQAVEKLDSSVSEDARVRIMENCGYNCANVNKKVIQRAKARRSKFRSLDEFLAAEQKKPMSGTRLVREGNTLTQFYTPRAFTRPMRCYCSLFRGLPDNETVSSTYCNCSKGFVKKFWEGVLEKPVTVDLVQSAISGASECRFVIRF
jgi:predicted hydrocarbon binding protein